MKATKYSLPLALVMLTLILACKKESPDKVTLLSGGPWAIKSSIVSPSLTTPDGSVVDLLAILYDCRKDDLLVFNAGGTFHRNEGRTKCIPGDYDIWEMGLWSFSQDQSKLYIFSPFSDSFMESTIVTLNESELVLRYQGYITDTITVFSITDTYQHP